MLRSVHKWLERDSGGAKRRQALTTLLLILALLLMTLSSAPIRPSRPAMAEPAVRRRSDSRWQRESAGKRSERTKLELVETVDGCRSTTTTKLFFFPSTQCEGCRADMTMTLHFSTKALSLRCGLHSAWIAQWTSSHEPKHCASLALCEKKKEKKSFPTSPSEKTGPQCQICMSDRGFLEGGVGPINKPTDTSWIN